MNPAPAPLPPPWWGWLVCLVSWVLLGGIAAESLAGAAFGTAAARDLVTVQVPAQPHSAVRIRGLLADGVLLRQEECLTQGDWSQDGDPDRPDLVHRGGGPAAVFFLARDAVVHLARGAGAVRLLRGYPGTVVGEVDLQAATWPAPEVYTTVPPLRVAAWWRWACLLAAALPLAVLRPWRSPAGIDRWLMIHVVTLHTLVWLTQWVGSAEDLAAYLHSWERNRAGRTSNHPPAYGALLVLAQNLPGLPAGHAVTGIQHGLLVATLLSVRGMLRRFVPAPLGQAWLLLTSALPPTLLLPQMIQSENLALFAMAATVWFALRAAESWSAARALAAAASLALGILARGVPLVAAGSALAIFLGVRPVRQGLRRAAAILGMGALPVLAVMAWIGARSGEFAIATGMGRHLYSRVVNEQRLVDEHGPALARLRALLPGVDPLSRFYWQLAEPLAQQGISYEELNALLGATALEGIRSAPLRYVSFSFALAWRDLVADPCDSLLVCARTRAVSAFRPPPLLAGGAPPIAWRRALDGLFDLVWQPLCWLAVLGVAGAAFSGRAALVLALAWLPAAYLLAAGFLEFFLPRYNVAVTPFVTAVAAVPLALAWRVRTRGARAQASSNPMRWRRA